MDFELHNFPALVASVVRAQPMLADHLKDIFAAYARNEALEERLALMDHKFHQPMRLILADLNEIDDPSSLDQEIQALHNAIDSALAEVQTAFADEKPRKKRKTAAKKKPTKARAAKKAKKVSKKASSKTAKTSAKKKTKKKSAAKAKKTTKKTSKKSGTKKAKKTAKKSAPKKTKKAKAAKRKPSKKK